MLPHFLLDLVAMPLAVALIMAVFGAVSQVRGRPRVARYWYLTAGLLTYMGSTRLVGDALLGPLESRYASLSEEQPPPPVGSIVVLGSGYRPRAGILTSAALDADGLVRVLEAIRLTHRLDSARLVLSGGAAPGGTPVALGYADLARRLGVPQSSIVTLDRPLDTRSEARTVAALLGSSPFILVTSAYHMPRAVKLLQRAGAHPIPAPVGQRASGIDRNLIGALIPGSSGLSETERALHEYLGLLAISLGLD